MFQKFIVVVIGVLLSGCAGTKNIYYERKDDKNLFISKDMALNSGGKARSKIISIRWPAIITPESRPIVVKNDYDWLGVAFGQQVKSSYTPFDALPDIVEASSTNYAAELYWSIRRLDSDVQIVLEPQAVIRNKYGKAVMQPLSDSALPVDVVVDLWATTSSWQLMVSQQFFSSIQAAPIRSGKNCGLMMATIGHEPTSSAFGRTPCDSPNVRNSLFGIFFLDGEERPRPFMLIPSRDNLPLTRDETLLVGATGYADGGFSGASMNDYVKNSRPANINDVDNFPLQWDIENYARMAYYALGLLTPVDANSQTLATLSIYVNLFDKQLGSALLSREKLAATQVENLNLIRKLLDQEIAIRAKHDERFAREIIGGAFGKQFRKTRDEAYPAYGQMMAKTLMAGFSMLAAQSYGFNASMSASQRLMLTNQSVDIFNARMEDAGKSYVSAVAPSLDSLGADTVSLLGDNLEVRASDQSGLRLALKNLYAKHMRKFEK